MTWPASATAGPSSFNAYVLKSVDMIAKSRAKGGYDLGSAYTRDLKYGDEVIPATPRGKQPPTLTMCVAGVSEVLIEAINIYAKETGDNRPYTQLPASTWSKGNVTSLRPYLFLQPDERNIFRYKKGEAPAGAVKGKTVYALARGTGHALALFNIGEEVPFFKLEAGDFINLNRNNGHGHAVVFISYIDAKNHHTNVWSQGVIGFQYFSAQGRGKPDAGFAYRDAYFGKGPSTTAGNVKDSGVIPQRSQMWLDSGRMWMPARWNVGSAIASIRAKMKATFPPTPTRGAETAAALAAEAPPAFVQFTDED